MTMDEYSRRRRLRRPGTRSAPGPVADRRGRGRDGRGGDRVRRDLRRVGGRRQRAGRGPAAANVPADPWQPMRVPAVTRRAVQRRRSRGALRHGPRTAPDRPGSTPPSSTPTDAPVRPAATAAPRRPPTRGPPARDVAQPLRPARSSRRSGPRRRSCSPSPASSTDAEGSCAPSCDELDRAASRFRADSEISRLAEQRRPAGRDQPNADRASRRCPACGRSHRRSGRPDGGQGGHRRRVRP